jgi:hypothetical protein
MALINSEDSFDDTEFVVGSDPSGMPPGMQSAKDDDEVEIDIEEETEAPAKKEAKAEPEDDFEIEVVDDTPASDRGREPLPDEVKEELENVDAEEYSAKVKSRIDQMKKAWHDERREKEAAQREREEAARLTKQLMEERNTLKAQLAKGEQWALEQAKERAQLQLAAAKAAYRDAYDSGDAERLTDAQEMLSRATYQADQANSMYPLFKQNQGLQQPEQSVYTEPRQEQRVQAPEPDDKAKSWGDKNKWFGNDDEMTSFALGLHQKLVKEGVPPTTDEYYERIDARMREVFPDNFEDAPKREKRRPTTNVAPAGRTAKGKKVALTRSQLAIAKKLGVSPEAYAKELMKQQES